MGYVPQEHTTARLVMQRGLDAMTITTASREVTIDRNHPLAETVYAQVRLAQRHEDQARSLLTETKEQATRALANLDGSYSLNSLGELWSAERANSHIVAHAAALEALDALLYAIEQQQKVDVPA
jgi:hypothetical protein